VRFGGGFEIWGVFFVGVGVGVGVGDGDGDGDGDRQTDR